MEHVNSLPFMIRLSLEADADERAIRRAYARELKLIDQETDPAAFQTLREAYDRALAWSRRAAPSVPSAPQHAEPQSATPEPSPVAMPAPAQVQVEDENASSAAVFEEFRQRSLAIPGERPALPQAPWIRELQHSLDDPRLVAIAARHLFEARIAHLLAQGWQPGHESLLVAAIKVFGWDKDRRRIMSLGRAGGIIDVAIVEQQNFEAQQPARRNEQRKAIERLRDARAPRTRELAASAPVIELLIARFPNWLALISSLPHAREWRRLDAKLPMWKRKLMFNTITAPKPVEKNILFDFATFHECDLYDREHEFAPSQPAASTGAASEIARRCHERGHRPSEQRRLLRRRDQLPPGDQCQP